MISKDLKTQLAIGWISGTLVTVVGLYLSYVLDLPCGPSVVAFYGLVLLGAGAVVAVVRSEAPVRALAYAGATMLVIVGVVFGLVLEGKALAGWRAGGSIGAHHGHHHHHGDLDHHEHEHGEVAKQAPAAPEEAAQPDPEDELEALRKKVAKGEEADLGKLLKFLEDDETPPFFKEEALGLFQQTAGQDFGYNAEGDASANQAALAQIRAWLKSDRAKVRARGGHGDGLGSVHSR
jgi:hypothetical protein